MTELMGALIILGVVAFAVAMGCIMGKKRDFD